MKPVGLVLSGQLSVRCRRSLELRRLRYGRAEHDGSARESPSDVETANGTAAGNATVNVRDGKNAKKGKREKKSFVKNGTRKRFIFFSADRAMRGGVTVRRLGDPAEF